jgi:hypothetical protein
VKGEPTTDRGDRQTRQVRQERPEHLSCALRGELEGHAEPEEPSERTDGVEIVAEEVSWIGVIAWPMTITDVLADSDARYSADDSR